jgi:hypothetical protein
MKQQTLDVEKLSVQSFETNPGDEDCPAASAGATTTPAGRPGPL